MPHPDMNDSWAGGHPDEGLLHEWLDEQLSAADADQMQAHVASCAECQARVAEARGLIAASHRILSALDEVPANVLPANFPTLDAVTTRPTADAQQKRTPAKRVFRWQNIGKVAAVLVFAVAIAKSGFMSDDVVVPLSAAKDDAAAGAAPAEAAAPVAPAPRQVASAERELTATERAAAKRAVTERAVADRAVAAGYADARDASGTAADKMATEQAKPSLTANMSREKRAAKESSVPKVEMATSPPALIEAAPVAVLSGRVAAARADAVAPPLVKADTISRAAPLATTAPTAERRAEMNFSTVVTSADTASLRTNRSASSRGLAAGAPMPSSPAAASPAARPPVALMAKSTNASTTILHSTFDSLTLSRNACTPSCEVTALHINSVGDVRYAVGVGNTQRVVMSKLSNNARDSLIALLVRTFPDSAARVGRVSCEQRGNSGTPTLQFVIDYAVRIPERATGRCAQSSAELRRLGVSVDSIADASALRLRVPPQN